MFDPVPQPISRMRAPALSGTWSRISRSMILRLAENHQWSRSISAMRS